MKEHPNIDFSQVYILVRLYEVNDDENIVKDITYATNSQNPIDFRDLKSNDSIQILLETSAADFLAYMMDYQGLKAAIIEMLSGADIRINIATFKNDIVSMKTKDDVLTYLIHLGYLGYNQERRTAFVPNEEIRQELITAVESKSWNEMLIFQQTSEEILNATLDMDTEEVAD